MEEIKDPRQEQLDRFLASGPITPVNPTFITAKFATEGSENPYYVNLAEQNSEINLRNQIRLGQAGVGFTGNQDDYYFYQNREVDTKALGQLGFENVIKYNRTSSKGWGEQNTYARDADLRWWKGESGNFFWNPSDLSDPTNVNTQSSYWSALGEGLGKWFADQTNDIEYEKFLKEIDRDDPAWTEDLRLQETRDFLDNNKGVAKVLSVGGINLYDYTRPSRNKTGHKFAINNAVVDALQNIRLTQYEKNTGWFGKTIDALSYGIQDPLLVRDLAVTTALTLGLGTIEMGAARTAAAFGQTTNAGMKAMSVAKGASNLLQLTGPVTGFVEGPVYKALQTLGTTVGKSGVKTALARGFAISSEAGLASGIANYNDQRKQYEWQELIFDKGIDFETDWKQLSIASATGFGGGGATLGLMRFGLGMLGGEFKYVKSGDWNKYWGEVANSLDTWAKTDQGLTVFGNNLSKGRGVLLGNIFDRYMKNNVDGRDFASVMVNGTKAFSNAVFTPQIAAKVNFDAKAAGKVADAFAAATGMPGEIVQELSTAHPYRVLFDNLTDPDYQKFTGMSAEDIASITRDYANKKANIAGPMPKTVAEVSLKDDAKNLATIFRLEHVRKQLEKNGVEFTTVADEVKKLVGQDLDFGRSLDRDNFVIVSDFLLNQKQGSKILELMNYAMPGKADFAMPDGTVIKGDVLTGALRKSLGLDERTSRIFITDSYDGRNPTFVLTVEPDGTVTRQATVLKKDSSGRISAVSDITKSADYKPENIKTVVDMQEAYASIKKTVDDEYAKEKKVKAAKNAADLEEAAKGSEEIADAVKDIGKLPTKQVLMKHFGLTGKEATALGIVMDIQGLDLPNVVLRVARATGKEAKELAKEKAKAAISWEAMKSGVQALVRSTEESDFGSAVHEMGHYSRALLIGNTDDNKAFRNKLGINDDLWNKFSDWVGYKGDWEFNIDKMTPEQIKAEEKFTNAFTFYIKSIMIGDGKTNATGLHRLFSAIGDHLGDLGKKMESQTSLEKGLDFTPVAKEVFEKLFLRSQANLSKFWEAAVTGIFKDLPIDERAKLGEFILGAELFNTWKATSEISFEKATKKTSKLVSDAAKVKKVSTASIVDSIKLKASGEGYAPTKKALVDAVRAGMTPEQLEARIIELQNFDALPPSTARQKGADSYFASHVKELSDEQLKALPEGTKLKPTPGVTRWFYNSEIKNLDVAYPVLTATKELIEKELTRREQSRAALAKLNAAKKAKEEVKVEASESSGYYRFNAEIGKYEIKVRFEESGEEKFITLEEYYARSTAEEGAKWIPYVINPSDIKGLEDQFTQLLELDTFPRPFDNDPEFQQLLIQLKEERAAAEIVAATEELERLRIDDPEPVVDEPMTVLPEVVPDRFVDNENRPVIDLSSEEQVVAESTAIVVRDVATASSELDQVSSRVVNPEIPLDQVATRVAEPEEPATINVEQTTPSVVEPLVRAVETHTALRAASEQAAAVLPESVQQIGDSIAAIATTSPKSIPQLLKEVLDDPRNATSIAGVKESLSRYVELRSRFLIVGSAIADVVKEDEATNLSKISQANLDRLEEDANIEKAIRGLIRLDFTETASRLGIPENDVKLFVDVKQKFIAKAEKDGMESDLRIVKMYESSVKEYEQLKAILTVTPTDADAAKRLQALEVPVGKYNAAVKRLQRRELGSELATAERVSAWDSSINDIMQEGQEANKILSAMPSDFAVRTAERAGYTNWFSGINSLKINKFFGDPEAEKTLPQLRAIRLPVIIDGKEINLNHIRLFAGIVTAELIDNKGVNIVKAGGLYDFLLPLTSQEVAIKVFKDLKKGIALLKENSVLYHGITALLGNSHVQLKAILGNIGESDDAIISKLLEINDKAKSPLQANGYSMEITTPRRLAYMLLTNNEFSSKLSRILTRVGDGTEAGVDEVIAKLYRSTKGIDGFLREQLGLKDATLQELYIEASNWAKEKNTHPRLTSALKKAGSRSSMQTLGTKARTFGEGVAEDIPSLTSNITEDKKLGVSFIENAQVIDVLQALFIDFIGDAKVGRSGLKLKDYFLASLAAARKEGGNLEDKLLLTIEESTGISVKRGSLVTPAKELATKLEEFSESISDNPELKKLIVSERLGIDVKTKKSATLKQAELKTAVAIKNDLITGDIKNAYQALEKISSSNSVYARLASELLMSSGKDLTKIRIFPAKLEKLAGAQYNPAILSILINNDLKAAFAPTTVIHEILHGVAAEAIDEAGLAISAVEPKGAAYLTFVKAVIDSLPDDEYNPVRELYESYVELLESKVFNFELNDINTDETKLGAYGLYSVHEMVSEALTNPRFAEGLNEIQSTTKADLSLLNRILEAVLSLFNLEKKENVSLLQKIVLATEELVTKDFSEEEELMLLLRKEVGISTIDPKSTELIKKAFEENQIKKETLLREKARANLSAANGRLRTQLYQAADADTLVDAADVRRRNLLQLGLNEETTPEDLAAISRILNGLNPIDVQEGSIIRNIKTSMQPQIATAVAKAFEGKNYREFSDSERRDFITNSLLPRIREVMGDRNVSAGLYSAATDSTFGKKLNALIGGAVNYADTADSESILLQFLSKIFDPMMDMRDGELKNKFNLFSIDKLNSETNNMILRSGLVQTRDKILSRVKDQGELKRINDLAWDYLTRPEELGETANKDLVLELIKTVNNFNKITVDLLSDFGYLRKTDPEKYGTMHIANHYAYGNQKAFTDALTNWAVKKTIQNNEISVLTANALGWLDIKRDRTSDEIISVIIKENTPLAKLVEEKQVGKKLDWNKKTKEIFADITKLDADAQAIHRRGLTSTADYTDDWKTTYAARGSEYTALRQTMEVAKNRYLGIDLGDSKSASPKRLAIGEGRNYSEERIISHDELAKEPELARFFSKDIFDLTHRSLRSRVMDATMTKYISNFFGVRMSMEDLISILSTIGEETQGRANMSAKELESRVRGYERVRSSWNAAIGNNMSAKDSVDKYYKVLLENSRIPLTIASGVRAGLTSVPETSRALLTSNKNKAMITQLMPNLVKMIRLIGPGGKNRRLARQQMISATHWLRGLSTDHLLHRDSMHPDTPFQGVVFGQNAGGMFGNFVNTWRAAGEINKSETNWLQRSMNRLSAFSSAFGAPLAFVNDVTTTLHIWNAQENFTKNYDSFLKMAEMLKKDPATNYSQFAQLAKKCGLLPKEALDLSVSGLLDPETIKVINNAAKNQALYTDGILDARKMYVWAGEDQAKIDAINKMGAYINMTARHTNTEPTLLDIRVNQSLYGRVLGQYMQFLLSMGVQEIGRRRRTPTSGYSQHLLGLLLMEVTAYGTTRALADLEDDNKGGYDEFINNPTDYVIRSAVSMPLLGSYSFLAAIIRQLVMGTSEYLGGPGTEAEYKLPDLITGPGSTAPRRVAEIPDTIKGWYNSGYDMISEMAQE